jgi:hypothetical protein
MASFQEVAETQRSQVELGFLELLLFVEGLNLKIGEKGRKCGMILPQRW